MLDIEPITLVADRRPARGSRARRAVADPADRRAWRLHVTAQAQPLIEKLRAVADEMIAEAFAEIDPEDIEITRRVWAQFARMPASAATDNRASNQ